MDLFSLIIGGLLGSQITVLAIQINRWRVEERNIVARIKERVDTHRVEARRRREEFEIEKIYDLPAREDNERT